MSSPTHTPYLLHRKDFTHPLPWKRLSLGLQTPVTKIAISNWSPKSCSLHFHSSKLVHRLVSRSLWKSSVWLLCFTTSGSMFQKSEWSLCTANLSKRGWSPFFSLGIHIPRQLSPKILPRFSLLITHIYFCNLDLV